MTSLPDDEKEELPPLAKAFFSAPHDLTLFSVDPVAECVGVDGRDDCTEVGLLAAIIVDVLASCLQIVRARTDRSRSLRVFGHVVAVA